MMEHIVEFEKKMWGTKKTSGREFGKRTITGKSISDDEAFVQIDPDNIAGSFAAAGFPVTIKGK